jgi:hypothetical protein
LGAKKEKEKKGGKLSTAKYLANTSMAKKNRHLNINDNGAQRWFGIISSIKPGRL